MIYYSTANFRGTTASEAIRAMCREGLSNIELSGSISYADGTEREIISLRKNCSLNLICHNYFPPAKNPFVLNLASLNDDIYRKSLNHFIRAIELSKKIGAKKFGFHAGFFLDMNHNEMGKRLNHSRIYDKRKCIKRFCEGFNILKEKAGNLVLYIENNVLSYVNSNYFKGLRPFMLLSYDDYSELKKLIDFNLLLDLGHLKVSASSLNLSFENELDKMIPYSDYLHISENDGLSDQHRPLLKTSTILERLKGYKLVGKTITLEIDEDIIGSKKSYDLLKETIS